MNNFLDHPMGIGDLTSVFVKFLTSDELLFGVILIKHATVLECSVVFECSTGVAGQIVLKRLGSTIEILNDDDVQIIHCLLCLLYGTQGEVLVEGDVFFDVAEVFRTVFDHRLGQAHIYFSRATFGGTLGTSIWVWSSFVILQFVLNLSWLTVNFISEHWHLIPIRFSCTQYIWRWIRINIKHTQRNRNSHLHCFFFSLWWIYLLWFLFWLIRLFLKTCLMNTLRRRCFRTQVLSVHFLVFFVLAFWSLGFSLFGIWTSFCWFSSRISTYRQSRFNIDV